MSNAELYHHGVKGQRWGIRRYQNKDGSLTPYGKKRYAKELAKLEAEKKRVRQYEQTAKKMSKLDDMRKDLDKRKKALKPDDGPEPVKQQKAQTAAQHLSGLRHETSLPAAGSACVVVHGKRAGGLCPAPCPLRSAPPPAGGVQPSGCCGDAARVIFREQDMMMPSRGRPKIRGCGRSSHAPGRA